MASMLQEHAFKRIGNFFHQNMAKNKYVRQNFLRIFSAGRKESRLKEKKWLECVESMTKHGNVRVTYLLKQEI
jgi:hypothetical protein